MGLRPVVRPAAARRRPGRDHQRDHLPAGRGHLGGQGLRRRGGRDRRGTVRERADADRRRRSPPSGAGRRCSSRSTTSSPRARSGATGANVDTGQGAYNADRVAQANALLGWLPGVQSDARTNDVALVGDFNSYTHEDPLETLYAAGWTNAAKQSDYSYNFDGLSGSLDHVLLNPSLDRRLTGSGVWNINSVEPVLREYSRYKTTKIDYYRDDVYRASDHDPVKVGLKKGKAREVTLTMLNFNDFHGRIAAASPDTKQFFGTIEQQRSTAGEGNTLVMSAGDNVGASLFASSVQEDQPTIDVLNAADLDVSAVGNHEFDRGFADLDRPDHARPPTGRYLGANVYKKGTTTPALPTYAIIERGGLKIGVVGAVTQETSTLVSPAGISGIEFGDPVTAVNRVTKQLTDGKKSNGEADVVVAEYHEGASKTQLDPTTGNQVVSLEDQLKASPVFAHIVNDTSPKVAAVFTAHTHQAYAYDAPVPGVPGATRPVTQSGSYAAFLTKVTLTVDTKTKAVLAHTQQNLAPTTVSDDDLAAAYPRVRRIAGIVDSALKQADGSARSRSARPRTRSRGRTPPDGDGHPWRRVDPERPGRRDVPVVDRVAGAGERADRRAEPGRRPRRPRRRGPSPSARRRRCCRSRTRCSPST